MTDTSDRTAPVQRIAQAGQAALDDVAGTAKSLLDQGVQQLADTGDSSARQLQQLADNIEGEGWLSDMLRRSAQGIAGATQSLRDTDLDQAMTQVSNFARKEPALFLGACALAGYAMGRVGKSAMQDDASSGAPESVAQPVTRAPTMPMTSGEGA
jgi:hypothetical protein